MPEELNPFASSKNIVPPPSQPGDTLDKGTTEVKGPNKMIIIVLVILGIIGLGVAVFGVYKFIVKPSPEFILIRAMENYTNLNSGSVESKLDILFELSKSIVEEPFAALGMSKDIELKLNLKGDFSKKEEFVVSDLTFNLDIPIGQALPFLGTLKISPEIKFITNEQEEIFIKIKGLGDLLFFNLDKIDDKWVKLDTQGSNGFNVQRPDYSREGEKEIQDKLIKIYRQHSYFVLTNNGTEVLHGEESWNIGYEIDNDVLINFLKTLEELAKDEEFEEFAKYLKGNRDYEEIREELNKLKVSGNVYISKETETFLRIVANIVFKDEEFVLTADNVIDITNFNQPITIISPTVFLTQQEAMELITSGSSGFLGVSTNARSAKAVADIKQLQTALGLYFNDQVGYPFPPLHGNRLGIDATSLTSKGFRTEFKNDGSIVYMGLVSAHPQSPSNDYLYYLCDNGYYMMEFVLEQDIGGLFKGRNLATPEGIIGSDKEIPENCLDPDKDGLSNHFEDQYSTEKNNSDTDGDGFLDGPEVMNGFNPNGAGVL